MSIFSFVFFLACRSEKPIDTDSPSEPTSEATSEPSGDSGTEPTTEPTTEVDLTGAEGFEHCASSGSSSNDQYTMEYCFGANSVTITASNDSWSLHGDAQAIVSPNTSSNQ